MIDKIYIGDVWRDGRKVFATLDLRTFKVKRIEPQWATALFELIMPPMSRQIDGVFFSWNRETEVLRIEDWQYSFWGLVVNIKNLNTGHECQYPIISIDAPTDNSTVWYIVKERDGFILRLSAEFILLGVINESVHIPVLMRFDKTGQLKGVCYEDPRGFVWNCPLYDKALAKHFLRGY